jgi:hypothetical protein
MSLRAAVSTLLSLGLWARAFADDYSISGRQPGEEKSWTITELCTGRSAQWIEF